MMAAIAESSIEYAVGYARSGHSVIWVDDAKGIDDALYLAHLAIRDEDALKIVRANGRERIEFSGGGSVKFFRSPDAVRGQSADVAFLASKHRAGVAMATIAPALYASDLGYIYALFERIG